MGVTRTLALFDLDGTLTWRDTLPAYLIGFIRHHPRSIFRLWRLPGAMLLFLADRDRGLFKQRLVQTVMHGATRAQVGEWSSQFADRIVNRGGIRPAALRVLQQHLRANDLVVLLSASPDLYVPQIGQLLGCRQVVCTEFSWRLDRLEGYLLTPNRRGAEKTRCLEQLKAQHPQYLIKAYANSASDIEHLRIADEAVLTNAGPAARRQGRQLGIALDHWTS